MSTNYSAHALDFAPKATAWFAKNFGEHFARKINGSYQKLKSAVKFRLPENGAILDIKKEDLAPFFVEGLVPLRLPFATVALEYCFAPDWYLDEGTAPAPERLLLAWEEGDLIACHCFIKAGGKFVPTMIATTIGLKDLADRDSSLGFIPFCAEGRFSQDQIDSMCRDAVGDVPVLLNFLCALACKNVNTADAEAPSAALNKARRSRGKVPFFTYKELVLQPGKAASQDVAGGTHASPRVHLRRGHVRRLPKKMVWVNAAVVGSKKLGMVSKDYRVIPKADK